MNASITWSVPITLSFEKQWRSDTSVEFAALFWKNRTPHGRTERSTI